MKTMGDRLRQARKDAGFTAARQAATKYGWPVSTYAAHENGQNEFGTDLAATYAKAFKVSAGWLLTGDGSALPGAKADKLAEVYTRIRKLEPEQQTTVAHMIEIILRGVNAGDLGQPGSEDNRRNNEEGPLRVLQALVQARPIFESSEGSEPSPLRSPAESGRQPVSPSRKSRDSTRS